MNAALQTLVVAVLVAAPRLAEACYVCSSGRDDETRAAFLLTTVFLSVLPLAIVGGGVLWLRRRFRQLERQTAAAAADPSA